MSASRLLSTLLLLQTRRSMTIGELAERLEVSTRTVRRDIDALSAAGVPVYAERGRLGGIGLLPGARIDVSRLDPAEVEALSLSGIDDEQRRQLGVHDAYAMATRKIDARRGSESAGLRDLVLVDNSRWFDADAEESSVADLVMDLRTGRRLALRYRQSGATTVSSRTVDPYGVVAKAGRWYLVADHRGTPKLFAVGRIASWTVDSAEVTRRAGGTLASVWRDLKAATERAGGIEVVARLRSSRLDLASRILGSRMRSVQAVSDEWSEISLSYDDIRAVRQLLQFGDHIEVLRPPEARDAIRALAVDLAERHG